MLQGFLVQHWAYSELVRRNCCIAFVASLSVTVKQQQTRLQFRSLIAGEVGVIPPSPAPLRAFCCAHEGHCNGPCSSEYHDGPLPALDAAASRYDRECVAAAELASDTIDIVFRLEAAHDITSWR